MDKVCVLGGTLVLKFLKMVFSNSCSVDFHTRAFSHPSVIHLSLLFGILTNSVDIFLF